MEYRTVSAKLPLEELTLFKAYCERKGTSSAALIRSLILNEMKVPVPHRVAGKNRVVYRKETDSFTWAVELDSGHTSEVMRDISPAYLEDLRKIIDMALEGRSAFMGKAREDSVAVPCELLGGSE